MSASDETLCLQWNDFKENVSSAFGDLRQDKEFTDVTLACEDGQQVEAHKVVLLSSSPFFFNLLKRNKHPHPLVYMRGMNYEDLVSIKDFLYYGEANVYQENLDFFLGLAAELQLKGLRKEKGKDEETCPATLYLKSFPAILSLKSFKKDAKKASVCPSKDIFIQTEEIQAADMEPKIEEEATKENIADLEELDQTAKSMMMFSKYQSGKRYGRARICKVCGKEGPMRNIMNHIEANHMNNVSIPCNYCGKTLTTRNALSLHKPKCNSQPGLVMQNV